MNFVVEGERGTDGEINEIQLTDKEKPIPKLSDVYAAMRILQCYELGWSCPGMEDIIFQLEDILMVQSLKHLLQTKITDFFTAKCI